MLNRMRDRTRHLLRLAALSAGLVAIGGLTWSPPAMAHGQPNSGHHHKRHKVKHHRHHARAEHRDVGYHVRSHRFVVPERIPVRRARVYRPYYQTRFYDPVHRHDHVVYRFPVHDRRGVVYQPFAYCGERLYGGGIRFTYRGPNLAISVGF